MALKRTRSRRDSVACSGGFITPSLPTPCTSQPPSPKRLRVEKPQAIATPPASTDVEVKPESIAPEFTSLFGSPVLSPSLPPPPPTPPLSPRPPPPPSPPQSPLAQSVVVPEKLPYADLPSGGRLFEPAKRQVAKFVREVRADLEQPMHMDLMPRGFSNPAMLCYRNAVLAALLNTDRFLAFLHAHMRQARRFYSSRDVSSHLLVRLYHLAVAYWERDGRHPMEPRDTYERLLALFWRACRTDVDESDGNVDDSEVSPDFSDERSCWLKFCNEFQDATVPLYRRQQDASDMMHWLIDACESQISRWPEMYGQGASLLRFQHMFDFRTTTRYVCTRCKHPMRLRRYITETHRSLQLKLGESKPRPGARVQRLPDYIERYFHDTVGDGFTCCRCQQAANEMPRLQRLQSTPEVLNVQIMRMQYLTPESAAVKNREPIDIPQFLDVSRWLEPHVYGTRSRIIYRLSAVISHQGTGGPNALGHYVTFVRKPTENHMFQKPRSPSHAWNAVYAEEELQNSIDGFIRAHGHTHPAPGQTSSAAAPNEYDDQWPLPDVSVVREQEARDNGWVCISDTNVRENVSYRKITNTSRDVEHTVASPEWFDPAMLVYEKWIEEFHTSDILGERVFQQPMNQNIGQHKDVPLPEKRPALITGEAEWLFEKEVEINEDGDQDDGNAGDGGNDDWDYDEFWNAWYGEKKNTGNKVKGDSNDRSGENSRLNNFLHLLFGRDPAEKTKKQ